LGDPTLNAEVSSIILAAEAAVPARDRVGLGGEWTETARAPQNGQGGGSHLTRSYEIDVRFISRSDVTVWRTPRGIGSAFMASIGSDDAMIISPKLSM